MDTKRKLIQIVAKERIEVRSMNVKGVPVSESMNAITSKAIKTVI